MTIIGYFVTLLMERTTSKAAANDLAKERDAMAAMLHPSKRPQPEPLARKRSPDSAPPKPKELKLKKTLTF